MKFLKIRSRVIDLENISYYDVSPRPEYVKLISKDAAPANPDGATPLYEDSEQPVVEIHFAGGPLQHGPFRLGPPESLAFLAYMKAKHEADEV